MFTSEIKKLWHGGLHNLLMFRQTAGEGARNESRYPLPKRE